MLKRLFLLILKVICVKIQLVKPYILLLLRWQNGNTL